MLQSQRTGLVLALLRGPCPPGLACLQETEDHTAQEAGAHCWGGAGGGPSGLSVDEKGERLSRESVLLRCHCPCQALEPTCHSVATPLPLEAQIKVDFKSVA